MRHGTTTRSSPAPAAETARGVGLPVGVGECGVDRSSVRSSSCLSSREPRRCRIAEGDHAQVRRAMHRRKIWPEQGGSLHVGAPKAGATNCLDAAQLLGGKRMLQPPPISRPHIDPSLAADHEDLWVFAYGSLMWRPGFPFVERVPARLFGAHRALCVLSHVHRGTPERPGLVLGLDRGGTCRGIAYRTTASERPETLAYLRSREQVTGVYR